MSTSKQDIDQALADVRRAYRLLHDYQRAALDAAAYIGSQLDLTYAGGYPFFSDCAPRPGKGSLDCWAWDWLNMVLYGFDFYRSVGEGSFIRLTIWLFSDTGFYLSDDTNCEKTDVATFASVECSGTKVGFLIYREWQDGWNHFGESKELLRRFLEKEGELPEDFKDSEIVGKCCDFSRLSDEESTDAVLGELVNLAKSKGFSLERIKKAL